jgi:hypothetical protein
MAVEDERRDRRVAGVLVLPGLIAGQRARSELG